MPAASERTRLLAPGAASAPPARADSCSPLALTLVLGTCVACGVLVRIPTILQSSIPIWLFCGRGLCPHSSDMLGAPRAGLVPSPLAFLTRLMQNGGVDEVARWLVESVELPQYEQAYWQLQLEPAAGARPTYNRGPGGTANDARA